MNLIKLFIIVLAIFSLKVFAETDFIETEKKYGLTFESSKENGTRSFKASAKITYNRPIEEIKKIITDYTNRCNNELVDKRIYFSKKHLCKYLSKTLVDIKVYKKLLSSVPKEKNEIDRFVVTKNIYSRKQLIQNELTRVFRIGDEKNIIYIIHQEKMSDSKTQKYIKSYDKELSYLKKSHTRYVLKKLGPNKTELEYSYLITTDHWLLNKLFVASKFFDGTKSVFENFLSKIH